MRRDDRGSSAVEFAIVFMLLTVITFGIFETSLLMMQWQRAEKATQMGARYAVVSPMVAPELATADGMDNGVEAGTPCMDAATGATIAACALSPNPVICQSGGCGGYGFDGVAFTAIVDEMRKILPDIDESNVVVEYRFVGLGFVGRPGGQPLAVTVRLQNMTFDLIVLDDLVGMNGQLAMPAFATTLAGEDLSDDTI
ncbi:MAG: pilus assembly protein [Alphaproteobacteria bacterium]|nr:pilus assembly protein [Alphaproteobacteria bacterium]